MKLDLDNYVPGLLLRLSNNISSSASNVYRERFGVSVTDWRLLSFFKLYPWSTASQACELMGLDKAAVSRAAAFLVEQGWLETRPQGLRKVEYRLTPAGNKLHDDVCKVALAREDALLAGFSKEEKEILVAMMWRMFDNVGAVRRVGRGSPTSRRQAQSSSPEKRKPATN
ncbi:MarR family transcriptional regulator [Ramlibacter sp. 2FC]|uniref:MarR family winged helix-turn-helix transcriptional regulator n=1 Tax=Ramlibacter sp. 2FC TaxID=2502188 RepID=UPI0010F8A915|nr:MarR family transcriptional regulator [Ramlibacter sp. 2FC]